MNGTTRSFPADTLVHWAEMNLHIAKYNKMSGQKYQGSYMRKEWFMSLCDVKPWDAAWDLLKDKHVFRIHLLRVWQHIWSSIVLNFDKSLLYIDIGCSVLSHCAQLHQMAVWLELLRAAHTVSGLWEPQLPQDLLINIFRMLCKFEIWAALAISPVADLFPSHTHRSNKIADLEILVRSYTAVQGLSIEDLTEWAYETNLDCK